MTFESRRDFGIPLRAGVLFIHVAVARGFVRAVCVCRSSPLLVFPGLSSSLPSPHFFFSPRGMLPRVVSPTPHFFVSFLSPHAAPFILFVRPISFLLPFIIYAAASTSLSTSPFGSVFLVLFCASEETSRTRLVDGNFH